MSHTLAVSALTHALDPPGSAARPKRPVSHGVSQVKALPSLPWLQPA
jgi:hypothetical protein